MSCLFPMKKKTKNIRAGLFVDDISGRSRCYTKFWATNMIIQQAETKFLVPKPTPLPPAKDELMSLILVVLETKSFVRKLVEYTSMIKRGERRSPKLAPRQNTSFGEKTAPLIVVVVTPVTFYFSWGGCWSALAHFSKYTSPSSRSKNILNVERIYSCPPDTSGKRSCDKGLSKEHSIVWRIVKLNMQYTLSSLCKTTTKTMKSLQIYPQGPSFFIRKFLAIPPLSFKKKLTVHFLQFP